MTLASIDSRKKVKFDNTHSPFGFIAFSETPFSAVRSPATQFRTSHSFAKRQWFFFVYFFRLLPYCHKERRQSPGLAIHLVSVASWPLSCQLSITKEQTQLNVRGFNHSQAHFNWFHLKWTLGFQGNQTFLKATCAMASNHTFGGQSEIDNNDKQAQHRKESNLSLQCKNEQAVEFAHLKEGRSGHIFCVGQLLKLCHREGQLPFLV